MTTMVNPVIVETVEALLHAGDVEVAYIRFKDGSVVTIGELITCDSSNVDS